MPVDLRAFEVQCAAVCNMGVGAVDADMREKHVSLLNAILVAIHPVDKAALGQVIGGLPFSPEHIALSML